MMIEYYGHSCFRIKDFQETGYKIVIDPYKAGSVPGLTPIEKDLTADMVLCSHDHADHGAADEVTMVKFEEGEIPFEVEAIESYHDDAHGSLRGMNTVHIITLKATGEKVIHYGDLGDVDSLLTDENLEKLSGADYALVPVGGYYTISAEQALELIDRTKPKLAIGMHYRSPSYKCGFDVLSTDQDFLVAAMETCHDSHFGRFEYIDTFEDHYPYEIMTLKPFYSVVKQG